MQSIQRQPDGRVNLVVSSTPGYGLWIKRATNFAAWLPLANLMNSNGTLNFTDAAASNSNAGFYRAWQ